MDIRKPHHLFVSLLVALATITNALGSTIVSLNTEHYDSSAINFSALEPGTISGGDIIACSAVTLTASGASGAGGSGTYTYQWQRKQGLLLSGTYTDISGETGLVYTPPIETEDYRYQVVVHSGIFTATTPSVYLESGVTVGGTVTAAETSISSTKSVNFTLTGHTGTVKSWQLRYKYGSGSFGSWKTFEGTDDIFSVDPILYQWSGGTKTYEVRAVVQNGSCSTIRPKVAITVSPSSGITSLPNTQSWESASDWMQADTDDGDWELISGATPSGGTGASSAADGNNYMFVESSSPNYPSKEFLLESPLVSVTSNDALQFDYHMYGNSMGSLDLEVSTNGTTWASLWSVSGDLGDQWNTATVSLASYDNQDVYFRLKAITGTSYKSDIAVDRMYIGEDIVPGTTTGGDVAVCEGTTMPTLTVSGYSGGNGSYQFQWQYKHKFNGQPSDWTDIPGASSASYTPSSSLDYLDDYDYQVVVSSGGIKKPSNGQYVSMENNPTTNSPGTLTSNISSDTCPFVDVEFQYTPDAGVSTFWTYLEGYYNGEWHSYGKISSNMTIMIHDGEKFRVNYDGSCKQMESTELIFNYIPGCNYPPSINKNFVRVEVPRVPITTDQELTEASQGEKNMSYSYQDGLGRSLQSVSVGSGVGFSDVYSYSRYDAVGRQERQFMPHVVYGGTGGEYLENIVTEAQTQYHTDYGDSLMYSKTEFENASSSKVLSTTGVGSEWHDNNKKQTFQYYWNDGLNGTGDILVWEITEGASDDLDKPESNGKFITNNTLYFTQSTNEEGIVTRSATDLRGRQIVSQIKYGTDWISTYPVYDDFDRVRFTIPPLAAELAKVATEANASNDALTQAQIEGFLFQKVYDKYGRVIKSKAPGAGWSYQVYDKWDRPVLSQDAAQREKGDYWSFVKYDHWNREIMTGEVDLGNDTFDDLSDDALNATVRYELADTTTHIGYEFDKTFPNVSEGDILTIHYYDDYSYLTYPGWDTQNNDFSYDNTRLSLPTTNDTTIKGEATGSKVRVLATNSDDHSSEIWLNTVLYLDDKGRIIQTIGENHLEGVDKISNLYDWEGKLLNMEVLHTTNSTIGGAQTLDILTSNSYDEVGNLMEVYQQLDQGPNVLVAQYVYNIYGELVEKNLHSEDAGSTFLQSLDYDYTLRGWLDQINNAALADDGDDEQAVADDLFGAKYHYTDDQTINTANDVAGRYDGNIVAVETQAKDNPSGSGLGVKKVGYSYDDQSRLTSTVTDNGDFDMSSSYDENGNIKTLTRKSSGSLIDDLEYDYDLSSNQVLEVKDINGTTEGFDNKEDMDDMEFGYDEAGNMTSDQNKRITYVGYNKFQRVDKIEFSDATGNNVVLTIENIYDASGNKLAKVILDADDNEIGRIDYIGAIEYYDYEINQVMTDEGRAYQQNGEYFYEYFIRDHQMNNRVSFGVLPYRKVHLATMETERIATETTPDDEGYAFSINPNVRMNLSNHTPLGNESAALNATAGRMVGPAIALEVGGTDYIALEAWAKYTDLNWNATTASGLAGGLTDLLNLDGASGSPTETVYNALNSVLGAGSTAGVFSESASTSEPDAFLQYLLFDEDSIFYQAGFQGVSQNAFGKYEQLSLELDLSDDVNFTGGFIYIYVANETNKDQEVFFDDLKVIHESNTANFKVSQINDFYPFGMMTTDSWRASGYMDPGLLYQSSYAHYDSLTGYYDFLSRSYDPALGRFFAMDPAGQFSSPYNGMGNSPVMGVDPDGEFLIPALIGAGIGLLTNGISNTINDNPFFDNAGVAALTGAIGGAASFGIGQIASNMSGLAKVGFQTFAHGTLGGAMSEATGGDFGSGFIAGGMGSLGGSAFGKLTEGGSNLAQGLGTVGGGVAFGGIGAEISGGDFWEGARNGAISSGLNHAVHTGALGKGIMMSSLTGKTRHLFGPDAKQIGLTGDAAAGGSVSTELSAYVILRGPEQGVWGALDQGVGILTDVGVSGGVEISEFYYSGKAANLNHTHFEGVRTEVNASFTLLPIVSGGLTVSYASVDNHTERLFSVGFTLTAGASVFDPYLLPYTLGANGGTTKLFKLGELFD